MSQSLADKYAIVGIGQSDIGELPGRSAFDLMFDAVAAASADAGISRSDIDGLICRGPDDIYCFHQRMGERLGINAGFSTTVDNGGASQILSVILAVMAIEAGLCTTVVCGYGRDAWSRTHKSETDRVNQRTREINEENERPFRSLGLYSPPAMHALGAQRHMARFGTTKEDFGAVAVAFRDHARRNPAAQIRKPLSMADYLAGRPIVDPFNMYDCSLRTDGAGAVVVMSADRARALGKRPVLIAGFGTHNNLSGWFQDENMVTTAAAHSGARAYAMSRLRPQDISTAQIYDCFTYMVITQLEDYGFCEKGQGGAFVTDGNLTMTGALPTNTSGGQLSEGHVEGMLQIVEGARQLRDELPADRQVAGATTALISGHGGNEVCHSTLILRKDGS
jgi:acetyl-CoA acetyltransferase